MDNFLGVGVVVRPQGQILATPKKCLIAAVLDPLAI